MGHPRGTHGNVTHGLTRHPLYSIWKGIMYRCYKEGNRYHDRGIRVCEQWHNLRKFISDIESGIGSRPGQMSLDRVDNDGNYEPGNVRWATAKTQANNRSKNKSNITNR